MRKHGLRKTRQYTIFAGIKQRCENKNFPQYKDYGGRGIKCEWRNFEEFWKDMQTGYSDELSIDRINNNGNYSKKNCRWATRQEQSVNTRRNIVIEFKGKKQTLTDWAKELGLNYWTAVRRISRGWDPVRALTQKIGNNHGKK